MQEADQWDGRNTSVTVFEPFLETHIINVWNMSGIFIVLETGHFRVSFVSLPGDTLLFFVLHLRD